MDSYTLTIAISVLSFIVVGSYAGRRVHSVEDYFVAGRRAPTLFILGTLVASVFSTSLFLGEAGFTYDGQMGPYLLLPGIAVTGYIYGALFFGTFLRRSRAPTVADYFGHRFNSRRVQQAAGVTIVFGLGGYLLVVTQGAALLLADLTALNYVEAVLASQGIKPDIASWHGTIGGDTPWPRAVDFLIWFIIIDLSWSVVYAVSPWQASRHLMARDEHVVLRASIYACFAVIIMQYLIYGAGGLVNLARMDIAPSETVLLWAARHLVPGFLGALLLAGIVAAALSSASTFLSLVGFSVSNDLGSRDRAPTLRTTRLLMGGVAIVVLGLSLTVPANVFWIMLFIGTVFASSWGPVAFMSVWSSRITAAGAFWGLVAGFAGNVIPAALEYVGLIQLPSYLNPALLGAVTSVAAIYLASSRAGPSAREQSFRQRLHMTPAEDRNRRKTLLTLLAPALLVLYGALMPALLLHWYVLPYQRGRGLAGVPGTPGTIDWSEAEPWFALGPALLFVPLGLIAARVIWRRYSPGATAATLQPQEESVTSW